MIRVAPARPADVLALTELLEEMDRFYAAAGRTSRDERMRQTAEALFSDPAAAHVLLAWDGRQLAGMAAYSYLWPAVGRTRSLYLKELYVGESHSDKLHETVTRHLQQWNRWTKRSWWPGQFVESDHDPGLTYKRDRSRSPSARCTTTMPSTRRAD